MSIYKTLLFLVIGMLFSCQTILRHQLGIKSPEIEKARTVTNLMAKHEILNSHFVKKEQVPEAFIGHFPKVFIYDKNGYQVYLPKCYEIIEENLYKLVDSIPDKLSETPTRDKFIQETIQTDEKSLFLTTQYDYEVYIYWSVWLGKFNLKKLRNAQKTVAAINQSPNQKKIILIPVNFDFIEEDGWTEETVEAALKSVNERKNKEKSDKKP